MIEADTTSEMAWEIWMPNSPNRVLKIHKTGIKTRPLRIMDRKVALPLLPIFWKSIFPYRERGMKNREKHWIRRAVVPMESTAGSES